MAFVYRTEPKSIIEALKDKNWVAAMHKELNQFTRNDVWSLVPNVEPSGVQCFEESKSFEGC